MNAAKIAGIILAGGASTRLGRAKQWEVVGGETLLARAIRTAHVARLSPVIAVVADLPLVRHVENAGAVPVLLDPQLPLGMGLSIRAGVLAAESLRARGAVVMTCDQVAITAEHLRALCAAPETIAGSAYAGRVGVPAYFPHVAFEALMQLEGDTGARELLHGARTVSCEDLALDVDTEAELERARAFLAAQEG